MAHAGEKIAFGPTARFGLFQSQLHLGGAQTKMKNECDKQQPHQ